MSLVVYPYNAWIQCAKCGAGAQRGGPRNQGYDSITDKVHMVCWSCKYEYLMYPADKPVVYIQKPVTEPTPWWKFW